MDLWVWFMADQIDYSRRAVGIIIIIIITHK